MRGMGGWRYRFAVRATTTRSRSSRLSLLVKYSRYRQAGETTDRQGSEETERHGEEVRAVRKHPSASAFSIRYRLAPKTAVGDSTFGSRAGLHTGYNLLLSRQIVHYSDVGSASCTGKEIRMFVHTRCTYCYEYPLPCQLFASQQASMPWQTPLADGARAVQAPVCRGSRSPWRLKLESG